jgi:hypothetical protein
LYLLLLADAGHPGVMEEPVGKFAIPCPARLAGMNKLRRTGLPAEQNLLCLPDNAMGNIGSRIRRKRTRRVRFSGFINVAIATSAGDKS